MKAHFSPSALCWLEALLSERYGHGFSISQDSDGLKLTLPGYEGEIF